MEITVKFTIIPTGASPGHSGRTLPDPHAVAEGLMEKFTNPNSPDDLMFRVKSSRSYYVELHIESADLVNIKA